MDRFRGAAFILVLGVSVALAEDERRDKPPTPAEQYQALLKERQNVPEDLSKAKTDEERKKVLARLGKLPLRFLELAEQNPKDPVALEALIQTVSLVNSTAFPAGGKDSPGDRALALLQRDHVRSDELGPVCQQILFGFHKSHETFLRGVLEMNSHPEVQALACLSLAQFLNDRLHRLDVLQDQDRPDLAERYHRVFGKDYIEELQWQDRATVAKEVETLFARAAEKYGDVKIPVTYFGSGGMVGEKAEAELFQIRHLAVGKEAPEIEGDDQDGKRFKLSDYRGKVVLLDFWYHLWLTWRAQWPHERSLVKNLADNPFALIGVHLNYDGDDASKVKEVMVKEKLSWRSFVDRGAIAEKWKPAGTPTFYIIDPKGVIRYKWAGAPGEKAIDAALEKLIQEAERDAKQSPK